MPLKFQFKSLKKQSSCYSGKKRLTPLKYRRSFTIKRSKYSVYAPVYDFELFKRNLHLVSKSSFILADKGYQGIYTVYPVVLLDDQSTTGFYLAYFVGIFQRNLTRHVLHKYGYARIPENLRYKY